MAYAAVISLKHNIEQLLHIYNPTVINPQIIGDAYDILCSLGDIFKTLDNKRDQSFDIVAMKSLDTEMRKVAWKLEDVLESYALHQMQMHMSLVVEQEIKSFIHTSKKFVRDFSRLIEDNLETGEEEEEEDEEEEDEGDVSAIGDFGGRKLTTIGLFKDGFERIMEWLLKHRSDVPLTITLLGMAGIGKTHFAREIYQHPLVVEHFEFKAWVRLGQKCTSLKKVLVEIIAQIQTQTQIEDDGKPRNTYVDEDEETLSALLRKSLDGRGECLVVLDDVWSIPIYQDIRFKLFKSGVSTFLLTTRIQNIYEPFPSSSINYQMPFWDKEKSWNLLWQTVFPDKSSFPPQLEKAGRKIAENCEGLPLLILVVANILSGADKTEEYWNKVANKKTTTFIDAYEKISKTLFSSYHYLSEHLKACFLYMGVFPQTCEIPLNKLNNLLEAEGFLEPTLFDEILGESFHGCVKRLVSHSIVISCKDNYYRMSYCKLHSAYWYLCVKEARNNKFMHVFNKLTDASAVYIESQRRLAIQNNMLFGIKEVRDSMVDATTTARSLLFTGEHHQYPIPIILDSMLLRVLDAIAIRLYEFPEEVVKLLLLRYLSLTHNGKLPSSISNLQKLQFLIVRQHHNIKLLRDHFHSTFLPDEIWEMKQLKYLRIMGHTLPNPRNDYIELPNLETLYVSSHSCTEAVMRGVWNLDKLVIEIELKPESSGAESLGCLEHIGTLLEDLCTLKCRVVNPRRLEAVEQLDRLSNLLPRYLRKLSLKGLDCSWKFMSAIGALPYLQVLKLRCCAFEGPKWEMGATGEFPSLKHMLLEDMDVVEWRIDKQDCFSSLKHLTIQYCFKLKEIPLAFGNRQSMSRMEVIDCSPSLVASATKIQLQNPSITLVINSSFL